MFVCLSLGSQDLTQLLDEFTMTLESRERPPLLVILPITFYVYARTSFPSLTGGDAGELLAEACQLGTAHPPGYPLFTMLIHTAMRISSMLVPGWSSENGLPSAAGAPALVANLLSCMFGSIAALFLALTVEEWTKATSSLLPCLLLG